MVGQGGERLALVHGDALRLPFGDETFDAVSCLEALEFFPSVEAGLVEVVRVLKPGGALFVTNRKGAARWYMPGRTRTPEELVQRLEILGMERVNTSRWQVDYDLAYARKSLP